MAIVWFLCEWNSDDFMGSDNSCGDLRIWFYREMGFMRDKILLCVICSIVSFVFAWWIAELRIENLEAKVEGNKLIGSYHIRIEDN